MANLKDLMMIEDIWSELQDYIPLRLIYEKLSQDDLFQLRLVCKEWNHAALQKLLPKPSFVTIIAWTKIDWNEDLLDGVYCNDDYKHGIVTYNADGDKSTCLTFRNASPRFRLRQNESHVPPFEVEGLILCHNPNNMEERGVFNVHTRTWHAIPIPPNTSDGGIYACGLIVDTTAKPFTFKLVEGFDDVKTQIYDSQSRSWSTTSSQMLVEALEYPMYHSCVCKNKTAYMSVGKNTILKYSMEADKWSTLEFPMVIGEAMQPVHNTLGVWEGRIFSVRENLKKRKVTVWELIDEERREWVEYARIPEEMHQWLSEQDFLVDSDHEDDDFENYAYVRAFFGDGYLLMCMCIDWYNSIAVALVLFNMGTKQWRRVHLQMEELVGRFGYGVEGQYFEDFMRSLTMNDEEDID